MALIKVYALQDKREELFSGVARSIKFVSAAALNVPDMPTTPGSIETVFVEGIDLIGIDYILEIIAVERPNQQQIAQDIIEGLNTVYPHKTFSVYFNLIEESGMANTPRATTSEDELTMEEAIKRSKS